MYQVKLQNFEGPLDLLHQLIESKKLEITEISLAEVADQFLNHLKNSNRWAMGDIAAFLTVAGRLALIKSHALLPFLKLTDDAEKDIENLKEQLAEYQKYRALAKEIHLLDKKGIRFYHRPYLASAEPVFYFPKKLKAPALSAALENLLSAITLPQRIPQAQVVNRISLEEKLLEIKEVIKNRGEASFAEVTAVQAPVEKTAAFLSVLELLKRGQVLAEQKQNFGEIKLKWVPLEVALTPKGGGSKDRWRGYL